ncbi:MAG TPA: DUF6498-containing protein, partial [Burkholderiaceae bacterium]|nr:DUF6498-containing protein [Burkholderiaceae bacterium]
RLEELHEERAAEDHHVQHDDAAVRRAHRLADELRVFVVAVREVPGALALASIVIAVAFDLVQWLVAHRDDENPKLVGETMSAPYGRIVVLHVVILGGAFLMQLFKAPAAAVLLLVALKLLADLGFLRRARNRPQSQSGGAGQSAVR